MILRLNISFNFDQLHQFMNYKSPLILALLLFICQFSYSQTSGKLRAFSVQDSAIIKLGDVKMTSGTFYVLDTGKYEVKAWAPKRVLSTKSVHITEGAIKTLSFNLPYTQEYKAYRSEKVNFVFKRITLRYTAPIVYLILAQNYLSNINDYTSQAEGFEKLAISAKSNYDQSIYRNDLDLYKGTFNQHKNNYNDANDFVTQNRTRLAISSGAVVVLTYLGWRMAKNLERPTYSEKRLLSSLSVLPIASPESTGLSLTLTLN